MAFDVIVRNARLVDAGPGDPLVDIGVSGGRYAEIAAGLQGDTGEVLDAAGAVVSPGFVETHIHLDKTCILDRTAPALARAPHAAMERVSAVKHSFSVEDVAARARRTLERCILHGTMVMRTHVEVDPKVGLRGLEGVKAAVADYRFAIDVEICVMPQEGLTNNPGTEELMVAALKSGARVIGAAPNYDSDPAAQIRRVFELAREFDVDIDMHLDSGHTAERLDTLLVCDLAEKYGWQGRVAIGHVTKLASLPLADVEEVARRMAGAGVALTVLPSTDLFLMGRDQDVDVRRGVVDANRLIAHGVTCSLSSNNILNPFTPFGDGQLLRQANLYANVVQRGERDDLRDVWSMFTTRSAALMRRRDYGIAVGNPADFVVLDAADAVDGLREIAPTLTGYKNGRRSYVRDRARLLRP